MEDPIIAGAIITVTTGLLKRVKDMQERGVVITVGTLSGVVGGLSWAAEHWSYANDAYTALQAVFVTVAFAVGLYEGSKKKSSKDDSSTD